MLINPEAHSDRPFIFKRVDVWNPDGVLEDVDVWVRNGHIVQIKPSDRSSAMMSTVASKGQRLALLPSAVDLQVHLRTPGQWQKETPETGLAAALCGGVGAVLTMPNTKPVIDSVEAVELCRMQTAPTSARYGIEVLISAAGTIGQAGAQVSPIADLVRSGVRAITDDGKGVESDSIQLEIFKATEPLGVPFLQHAETLGAAGPLAPGPVQEELGLSPYDERHEVDMVKRDLELLKKAPNARYHLLHTSSAKSLELIRQAKKQGLKVTAEVSPHHLFFASHHIDPDNKSFKMNPPIRSELDRQQLIDALSDGTIDFVATDHAPHESSTKAVEFERASFGTLGLETLVPVVLTLVRQKRLSRTRAVQVLSSVPAQFIGLEDGFGSIRVGQRARFAVVDPAQEWTVRAERLQSLSKNSCFEGATLWGRVVGHVTPAGFFEFEV